MDIAGGVARHGIPVNQNAINDHAPNETQHVIPSENEPLEAAAHNHLSASMIGEGIRK